MEVDPGDDVIWRLLAVCLQKVDQGGTCETSEGEKETPHVVHMLTMCDYIHEHCKGFISVVSLFFSAVDVLFCC